MSRIGKAKETEGRLVAARTARWGWAMSVNGYYIIYVTDAIFKKERNLQPSEPLMNTD